MTTVYQAFVSMRDALQRYGLLMERLMRSVPWSQTWNTEEWLALLNAVSGETQHALACAAEVQLTTVAQVDEVAQLVARAREEQREACARALDPEMTLKGEWFAAQVRATPLDSTPLADGIRALTERAEAEVTALRAERDALIERSIASVQLLCSACGAPYFNHYCYNCSTNDPCAAEPQKGVARLARIYANSAQALKELRAAVRELIAAERSQRDKLAAVWARVEELVKSSEAEVGGE